MDAVSTCSEHRSDLDPEEIAFHAIVGVDLGQPFELDGEIEPVELRRVGYDRADAYRAGLERAERRAGAAIGADLLVIERARPRSQAPAREREVLRKRRVDVELRSRLVIRRVVPGVDIHGHEPARLEARRPAQPGDGEAGFEGPVVLPQVGEGSDFVFAGRRVDAEAYVVPEVAA